MFKNYKINLLKIIILMVGLTIAHLGVTLFLLTNLGSDPYNVLVQGVYRTLSNLTGWEFLTHGRVHIALCFLIILILLATDKTYIKIGTVLCMIFGGPIIDMFTLILKPVVSENSPLPYKLIILALGCVILAYGMTIVIKSDAGTGPNDLVAVVISDKTKRSFGIVRVITDISFVLAGFLLGGSVGLGTVICAACVGPVANIFLPINEKLIQKVYILFFPTAI
ncbi:YczE/YyaS/YitT family protein [Lachnospiraceae bacterium HCP28S3_F9]|uniref:YczE/YyaS/YitT family protein n=1 Tax=Dorea sp. YH-dor228 TaxID=3151120 RepID=UPI0032421A1B